MSEPVLNEQSSRARILELEAENASLRADLRDYEEREANAEKAWRARLEEHVDGLRLALDRAGTRLAQVQPAIDPACTWALGIVPQAEEEIRRALQGSDDGNA